MYQDASDSDADGDIALQEYTTKEVGFPDLEQEGTPESQTAGGSDPHSEESSAYFTVILSL